MQLDVVVDLRIFEPAVSGRSHPCRTYVVQRDDAGTRVPSEYLLDGWEHLRSHVKYKAVDVLSQVHDEPCSNVRG